MCYEYAQFVIWVCFASLHMHHRNPEKQTATPKLVSNVGIFNPWGFPITKQCFFKCSNSDMQTYLLSTHKAVPQYNYNMAPWMSLKTRVLFLGWVSWRSTWQGVMGNPISQGPVSLAFCAITLPGHCQVNICFSQNHKVFWVTRAVLNTCSQEFNKYYFCNLFSGKIMSPWCILILFFAVSADRFRIKGRKQSFKNC